MIQRWMIEPVGNTYFISVQMANYRMNWTNSGRKACLSVDGMEPTLTSHTSQCALSLLWVLLHLHFRISWSIKSKVLVLQIFKRIGGCILPSIFKFIKCKEAHTQTKVAKKKKYIKNSKCITGEYTVVHWGNNVYLYSVWWWISANISASIKVL